MFQRSPLLLIFLATLLWGCSNPIAATSTPPIVQSESNRVASNMDSFAGQQLPVLAQVQLGETMIDLEVTRTPQEQALGLMFRPSLADDRGMLFEFNPPRPVSFWMKNVVIPLDMIFVREGKILSIAPQVPPCSAEPCPTYGPQETVDQVIELRGGRAAELGLTPGDLAVVYWLPSSTP